MRKGKQSGISTIEVLVVAAILAIFSIMVITSAKFLTQLQKARDAKRKADLSTLQKNFEDYYGDNGQYPEDLPCGGDNLRPYLNIIPCDPRTKGAYKYVVDPENPNQSQWYMIFTKLEIVDDPIIGQRACYGGCQFEGDDVVYNYLVTSPNLPTSAIETIVASIAPPPPIEAPGPTSTPVPVGPTSTLTPTATPTTVPPPPISTPTPTPTLVPYACPEGQTYRVLGPFDCGNPSAYCPPQGGTGCCVSGALYCSDSFYWCCEF